MMNKKQIALRLKPSLVKQLDDIRPHTCFHTRTEFIETACSTYLAYLKYRLEMEALK
jgi:metal-responsive CopG/Arc/MetJ family transcriptional regulator